MKNWPHSHSHIGNRTHNPRHSDAALYHLSHPVYRCKIPDVHKNDVRGILQGDRLDDGAERREMTVRVVSYDGYDSRVQGLILKLYNRRLQGSA